MNRRDLLKSSAAVGALSALPAAAGSADAKLAVVLDEIWEQVLDESPEYATVLGLDTGPRARQRSQLSDISRGSRAKQVARNRAWLKRLDTIDRKALPPARLIDLEVVEYQARVAAEGGAKYGFGEDNASYAPFSPYAVSQLGGPAYSFPDFLDSNHPVQTASDAEAWLTRLAGYPKLLDTASESLRIDAAAGVLAPDFALDSTLTQLTAQRGVAPADAGVARNLAAKAKAAGLSGDWVGAPRRSSPTRSTRRSIGRSHWSANCAPRPARMRASGRSRAATNITPTRSPSRPRPSWRRSRSTSSASTRSPT